MEKFLDSVCSLWLQTQPEASLASILTGTSFSMLLMCRHALPLLPLHVQLVMIKVLIKKLTKFGGKCSRSASVEPLLKQESTQKDGKQRWNELHSTRWVTKSQIEMGDYKFTESF